MYQSSASGLVRRPAVGQHHVRETVENLTRVQDVGCADQGLGLGDKGLGFGVWGLGFGV
jgi:hypothetical protein